MTGNTDNIDYILSLYRNIPKEQKEEELKKYLSDKSNIELRNHLVMAYLNDMIFFVLSQRRSRIKYIKTLYSELAITAINCLNRYKYPSKVSFITYLFESAKNSITNLEKINKYGSIANADKTIKIQKAINDHRIQNKHCGNEQIKKAINAKHKSSTICTVMKSFDGDENVYLSTEMLSYANFIKKQRRQNEIDDELYEKIRDTLIKMVNDDQTSMIDRDLLMDCFLNNTFNCYKISKIHNVSRELMRQRKVKLIKKIIENLEAEEMKSKIEWTEKTWNPVTGCTKHSDGCLNCYAEKMTYRLKAMGVPNYQDGFEVRVHENKLNFPFLWSKPKMFFVNSMSDLFHENVPVDFLQKVFDVMNKTPQHTYQILTKRAERLLELNHLLKWTPNIWMGVTVEKECYINRIDLLRQTGATVKFLSMEPLLEPINDLNLDGINWVIVGGESGTNPRPMKESWVLDIKNACKKQNVPFFFKQWGGKNKKKSGRILKGRTWDEMPIVQSQTNQ